MSVRSDWVGSVMVLAWALSLSGCSSGSKTSVQAEAESVPAVDASLDSITPESSSLAAQSQRDVEAILKARTAADSASVLPKPDSSIVGESPAPAVKPRRPIVWNDPKSKPAAAAQPKFHPQPLARLPAESLASTPVSALTLASTQPSLEPDRLKQLMVDLTRELNNAAAYSDVPLKQIMLIASMNMIDPERSLNPEAFHDLTPKERELLGKLQTFFADLGRKLDGADDVEQAIVESVTQLRQALVREPQLTLPTLALCTRVGGFGDYKPFERNSFLAGSEQKSIVYMEIAQFTSELNQNNQYVTELAQQLTIYSDRDGIPVWKEDWQSATDLSKNQRKDFFTVQVITLPKALSVGKYQLKVRVRDEKSGAEAEGTMPFEMVADPKMVGK